MYSIFFTIDDITSSLWHQTTIFMTSHPLYLTSYPCYLCHHIHCIDGITPTVFMRSHPLYMTTSYSSHHTNYIWHHTHDIPNVISAILPTISDTASTISVSSNPVYQIYHTHSLDDITHTIFMTSYLLCTASHEPFMTSNSLSIFLRECNKCSIMNKYNFYNP